MTMVRKANAAARAANLSSSLLLLLLLLLLRLEWIVQVATASSLDHVYEQGEPVDLWVNKIGPYANPQEAYEYYSLPYCAPNTNTRNRRPKNPHGNTSLFNNHHQSWMKLQMLGEYLSGHALRHSGYDITFDFKDKTESCTTQPLTKEQASSFSTAVQHRWFYQMYLDDLPVYAMVGEMLPPSTENKQTDDNEPRFEQQVEDVQGLVPYVYTTRILVVKYNNQQIVQVDLSSDYSSLVRIQHGVTLTFSLKVHWEPSTDPFDSRLDRYIDHTFFNQPMRWYSVYNANVMILLLMGFMALVLIRTLKKDYARYDSKTAHKDDVEQQGSGVEMDDNEAGSKEQPLLGVGAAKEMGASDDTTTEETGWKQVHGDVFRAPTHLPLLAALIGAGWQLFVLAEGVILFCSARGKGKDNVDNERGNTFHLAAVIVCYCLSSMVAGYTSGKFFEFYYPSTAEFSQTRSKTPLWQIVMILTIVLLPTVTAIILSALNTLSLVYGTINAVSFLVFLKLFCIWIVVSAPLTVIGTLLGRRAAGSSAKAGGSAGNTRNPFPCRVNSNIRPIPTNVLWYRKSTLLIPMAGFLSFAPISVELYFAMTSLWNYKYYQAYGFLLFVYGILILVVGMTSITVIFLCLNAEDHRWQWTAFASGASTAVYVFGYSIYYFFCRTQVQGLFQTTFYFGFMSLVSIWIGLLCGSLGHGAASCFVQAIFKNLKVD